MFGASNQLIAAVVLIAISAYLVEHKKPIWYTIIPSFFMVITSIGALIYGLFREQSLALIIISVLLIIFAIVVFIEILYKISKKKLKKN